MSEFYLVVVYVEGSAKPRLFAFTNPDEVIRVQADNQYSTICVYKTAPKDADNLFTHISGPNLFKHDA